MQVTMTLERYKELVNSELKLYSLEAGGVDNWEWYSESLRDNGYYGWQEKGEPLPDDHQVQIIGV